MGPGDHFSLKTQTRGWNEGKQVKKNCKNIVYKGGRKAIDGAGRRKRSGWPKSGAFKGGSTAKLMPDPYLGAFSNGGSGSGSGGAVPPQDGQSLNIVHRSVSDNAHPSEK
jgi:hypothetical protein